MSQMLMPMMVMNIWTRVKIIIKMHPMMKLNNGCGTWKLKSHLRLDMLKELLTTHLPLLFLVLLSKIQKELIFWLTQLIFEFIIYLYMSKNLKTPKQPQKQFQRQNQTEDVDLRLERHMQLCLEVQQEYLFQNAQNQYAQEFLDGVKSEHEAIKKCFVLGRGNHFGGWEAKIKHLGVTSITSISGEMSKKQQGLSKRQDKRAICSQGKHLQQILDSQRVKKEQLQIKELQEKLNALYDNTGAGLRQELLSDKILSRIKRQAKKASKIKTLLFIQKQIGQFNDWKNESSSKINSDVLSKQIQDKIVHNLQLMKLVMNKKIINNDYIYEQFGEENANTNRLMRRISQLGQQIKARFNASCTILNQKYTLTRANRAHHDKKYEKKVKSIRFNQLDRYFSNVRKTLTSIQSYQFQQQFNQKYLQLSKLLDNELQRLKK